jgi:hypothetical protein
MTTVRPVHQFWLLLSFRIGVCFLYDVVNGWNLGPARFSALEVETGIEMPQLKTESSLVDQPRSFSSFASLPEALR